MCNERTNLNERAVAIASPAIRYKGKVTLGHSHIDALLRYYGRMIGKKLTMLTAAATEFWEWAASVVGEKGYAEGFVTTQGKFVSRKVAMSIARAAGQAGYEDKTGELKSEMLRRRKRVRESAPPPCFVVHRIDLLLEGQRDKEFREAAVKAYKHFGAFFEQIRRAAMRHYKQGNAGAGDAAVTSRITKVESPDNKHWWLLYASNEKTSRMATVPRSLGKIKKNQLPTIRFAINKGEKWGGTHHDPRRSGGTPGSRSVITIGVSRFYKADELLDTRTFIDRIVKLWRASRGIFIHEYMHYLDSLRYRDPESRGWQKPSLDAFWNQGETGDDYYLGPHEFNAYFQEAADYIIEKFKWELLVAAYKLPPGPVNRDDFLYELAFFPADIMRRSKSISGDYILKRMMKELEWNARRFFEAMMRDDKYKRKLIKRSAQLIADLQAIGNEIAAKVEKGWRPSPKHVGLTKKKGRPKKGTTRETRGHSFTFQYGKIG